MIIEMASQSEIDTRATCAILGWLAGVLMCVIVYVTRVEQHKRRIAEYNKEKGKVKRDE